MEKFSYIVGMVVDEATKKIEKEGFRARIVSVDGNSKIITMDLCSDRINLHVEDNKVIKYEVG